VRSPWNGKITKIDSHDGKVIIGIETALPKSESAADLASKEREAHKVELAFDGVPFQVSQGDVVKAGQTVGHLGKSARGILLRQTLVQGAIKSLPTDGASEGL
jgi:hypothetical protein